MHGARPDRGRRGRSLGSWATLPCGGAPWVESSLAANAVRRQRHGVGYTLDHDEVRAHNALRAQKADAASDGWRASARHADAVAAWAAVRHAGDRSTFGGLRLRARA